MARGDDDRWGHEVLLAALRGEIPDELLGAGDETRWRVLLEATGRHGLQGWLARALRGRPVAAPVQVELQAAALRVAGNHRRRIDDARTALGPLADAGIEVMLLKGPGLVERYYRDPTLRPYGDIDLYVRPGDFADALQTLLGRGFSIVDRNWEFLIGDLRGQLHLQAPSGGTIELHWHPINGLRQRRTLGMAPDEPWDSARSSELAGTACVGVPSHVELAHLLLHTAMHGCNRLIWMLDIAQVATAGPDWDGVVRCLRRWRFASGGALVLDLARRWIGAPMPADVIADLAPGRLNRRTFQRLVGSWDLAHPDKGAHLRELFFATVGDGARTRLGLIVDLLVPAPGQQSVAVPGPRWWRSARRLTLDTTRRIGGKITGTTRAGAGSEYLASGDAERGLTAYLAAVDAAGHAT